MIGNTVQIITGYKVLQSMKNPMLESTSPSDFWGRKWNVLVHSVMKVSLNSCLVIFIHDLVIPVQISLLIVNLIHPKRGVYKPVRKYSSSLVASLAVFVMSGLFHEWLVHAVLIYNRPTASDAVLSGDILIGSNTAFFVWNFVVIATERFLARSNAVKSIGTMMPRYLVTFTIIMTSLPFAHW